MLKNRLIKIGIFLSFLLMQGILSAAPGLFFNVISSGTAAQIEISLCLNGKGPVSCQNYTISGLNIAIKTQVPTHPAPYSIAGIRINTPGYTLVGAGVNCTPYPSGYCLFTTGNSDAETKYIEIQPSGAFTVGGSISGLTFPGLILQNNGTDDLPIAANATQFQFPTPITGNYNVTVLQNPTGQLCTVMNGSGTGNGNVTNVSVICSTFTYTIGGTIAGLTMNGLVLQNNGADDLNVPANATTFEFAIPVTYGSGYNVQVLNFPGGGALSCQVYNGTGTNVTANVNNVVVQCNPPFAYYINQSLPGIVACGLNPDGTLGSCNAPINPNNTLSGPTDITVNRTRDAAFITNFSADNIAACTMDAAGTITGCVPSGAGFLADPSDITINTSFSAPMLYIVQINSGIQQCSVSGTTVNYPCTLALSSGNYPRGLAINSTNTKLYTTGTIPFAIQNCDLDSNGLIVESSCQSSALSFPPLNLAINSAGTRAYVSSPIQGKVYICSIINGIVDASSCADSGQNISSPYIGLNSTETTVYLVNSITNIAYQCPVQVTGNVYSLGACTTTPIAGIDQGFTVTN